MEAMEFPGKRFNDLQILTPKQIVLDCAVVGISKEPIGEGRMKRKGATQINVFAALARKRVSKACQRLVKGCVFLFLSTRGLNFQNEIEISE
jgi:hypothetical protein